MPTSGRGNFGSGSQTNVGRNIKRKDSGAYAATPAGYKGCNTTFANKIQSFKTLIGQTQGPAKGGRPSPSTLNSFANWINKGAIIQTCSPAQLSRWAKSKNKNFNTHKPTPAACKTVLCAKFGKSAIKAVARSKSGSFMVVTTPTNKGKKFCFPK